MITKTKLVAPLALFFVKLIYLKAIDRKILTISKTMRENYAHCTKRSWYQLMSDTKKVMLPYTASPFLNIREHLVKFKALKLEKFLELY